jgi:CUG-BP- and ETR3-like factor
MPCGLSMASALPVPHTAGLQASFLEAMQLEPVEVPPLGCAPDAIKLFVGNVPKVCNEEQLLPMFQAVGKVRAAAVGPKRHALWPRVRKPPCPYRRGS